MHVSMKCEDCFYFVDNGNGLTINGIEYGNCMNIPPEEAPQGNLENIYSRRPTVAKTEYCGHFRWHEPYVEIEEGNDLRLLFFESIKEVKIIYNSQGEFVRLLCWTDAGLTPVTDKDDANRILTALYATIVIP